jgi:hypothetical protein
MADYRKARLDRSGMCGIGGLKNESTSDNARQRAKNTPRGAGGNLRSQAVSKRLHSSHEGGTVDKHLHGMRELFRVSEQERPAALRHKESAASMQEYNPG